VLETVVGADAVFVYKATQSFWKGMSVMSNLERLNLYTLGRVNDFEKRAILDWTR